MQVNSVEEILEDIRMGKMVVLMDDEDRENEGDLVMAATMVRPEDINFMATYGRGLICLTLTGSRCEQLNLPLMVGNNKSGHGTNFTVSIEAATGVTTGISAADRARTVLAAVSPHAKPSDIVQPGHIFPLRAVRGGVLSRAGHTEAGCDLARLAGMEAAAVIVEIMNEDGTMARRPDLEKFAEKHGLKIGTIADLIHYRLSNETTLVCETSREVRTKFGEFTMKTYRDLARDEKHFVLQKGTVVPGEPTLVRVHLSSTARDVLSVERANAYPAWTVPAAMEYIANEGSGVVVLIYHSEDADRVEEEVVALVEGKTEAQAHDVVYRQVGAGSQILRDLGVSKMRLMGAPFKFNALSGFDLEVVEFIGR